MVLFSQLRTWYRVASCKSCQLLFLHCSTFLYRAAYPLALLRKLLDVFQGRILFSYDIGCAFETTARLRNVLGNETHRVSYTVPSWHGWSHNRLCQLSYHPLYRKGTGIEDFEGCERLFSFTNNAASSSRHVTPYHRQQLLHFVFAQWDRDKYLALGELNQYCMPLPINLVGNFIFQNYRQATELISVNTRALEQLETEWGNEIDQKKFMEYIQKEKDYIKSLKEPPASNDTVGYMKALVLVNTEEYVFHAHATVNCVND